MMNFKEFEVMVRKDFTGPGPCPTCPFQVPAVTPNKSISSRG